MRYSPLESAGGNIPEVMTIVVPTSQNPGDSEKSCGSVKSEDEPWGSRAYNASSQVLGNP